MAHLTLYRKWRPQRFGDVLGQEHVVRTLTHALKTGRVAHAYLFAGPRGTGKTTLARLLAKGLNCEAGPTPEPCNRCASCVAITAGNSLDVVEIDGASNRGIDEIRELRERVRYAPAQSGHKVYIVDEVHMLTHEAFNALLKVLEEPPAHVVFVFATTEPHRVPATILSRCQRFDLRRLSVEQLAVHLDRVARAEGMEVEPAALELIARHADGGARDALALLEQCAAYQEGCLTAQSVAQLLGLAPVEAVAELAAAYALGDVPRGLQLLRQLLEEQGVDSRVLLRDLLEFLREAAALRALEVAAGSPAQRAAAGEPAAGSVSSREQYRARLAASVPLSRLVAALEALMGAEPQMRWAPDPGLVLELELMRLGVSAGEVLGAGPAEQAAAAEQPGSLAGQPAARPAPLPEPSSQPAARPAAPPQPSSQPSAAPASPAGPPAPGPAPAGSAGRPAPAGLSLEEVQARWGELLATLKGQQRRMAARVEALLREGRPVRVEGLTVVVGFPPDREFHRAGVEEPQSRALVEKVLTRLLGRPVSVRTERLDGEPAGPELPPAVPPAVPGAPLQTASVPGDGSPTPPGPARQRPAGLAAAGDPHTPTRKASPAAARDGAADRDGAVARHGAAAWDGEDEFDPGTLQAVLNILGGRLLKELDPEPDSAAEPGRPGAA